jgi:single-stranded-DNA-specific exonuclease
VTVCGDFDVDGITSTATITEAVNDLVAARSYIPNREREGYGLNKAAIESIAAAGTKVLVTCDCGTTNVAEIGRARELGLDVLVLDHHTPPDRLPNATALVNPKLPSSRYLFSEYATAGLAYRFAGALYEACGRSFPDERYLDLAALGTVADLVPLVDENREIVRRGLSAVAGTSRPGVAALMSVAGIDAKQISARAIGFTLGPRLNAAGRLQDAGMALELLMTRDEARAWSWQPAWTRSTASARHDARGEALALEMTSGRATLPLSMVGAREFHQGIVGLVASPRGGVRPSGRRVPDGRRVQRGSCRSIPEYDIVSGLKACGDLFERYGGHRQAGGFTIRNSRLPELEERMVAHAAQALAGVTLGPVLDIARVGPEQRARSGTVAGQAGALRHGQPEPSSSAAASPSWTLDCG